MLTNLLFVPCSFLVPVQADLGKPTMLPGPVEYFSIFTDGVLPDSQIASKSQFDLYTQFIEILSFDITKPKIFTV